MNSLNSLCLMGWSPGAEGTEHATSGGTFGMRFFLDKNGEHESTRNKSSHKRAWTEKLFLIEKS